MYIFVGLQDGHYPPQGAPRSHLLSGMTLQSGFAAPDAGQLRIRPYGRRHRWIFIAPANVVVVGDIFSNRYYPIIDSRRGIIDG